MKAFTAFFQIVVLVSVAMAAGSRAPTAFQRSSPIALGDTAPDFTLEDTNKNKVTLSEARGKSPVVLVFYRGYW